MLSRYSTACCNTFTIRGGIRHDRGPVSFPADCTFVNVLTMWPRQFNDTDTLISLYWRPHDGRTRILISTIDERGRENLYCLPLTSLIALRERSLLKLCQASRRDGELVCWAKLRFIHYERMVLFYSTFVALKCQDPRETPWQLLESPGDLKEVQLYGGVIRDGDMLHALRLYQESNAGASGVYRLEAAPLRGNNTGIPIWTAFVTKYVETRDQDFFVLERNSAVVTMCCPKPMPFVFCSNYSLQMTRGGEYVLEFESRGGELYLPLWCVLEFSADVTFQMQANSRSNGIGCAALGGDEITVIQRMVSTLR